MGLFVSSDRKLANGLRLVRDKYKFFRVVIGCSRAKVRGEIAAAIDLFFERGCSSSDCCSRYVGRLVNLIGILAVDFLPTLTTNGEKERQERGGEQERRKRNDRGITRKTILPRTFPTACTVSQKRQLEKILPACL